MNVSEYKQLSYNVSNFVYRFVCLTKYCRMVFDDHVDKVLKEMCEGIELRCDYIEFLEISMDKEHVHF